jgi:hypothetical protein
MTTTTLWVVYNPAPIGCNGSYRIVHKTHEDWEVYMQQLISDKGTSNIRKFTTTINTTRANFIKAINLTKGLEASYIDEEKLLALNSTPTSTDTLITFVYNTAYPNELNPIFKYT